MQSGGPDSKFLHLCQDTGGGCFEWRDTPKVHGCADEIAVRAVGIQGQSNLWKSGSRVAPMIADAGGVNGILVEGGDLWNRCKNLGDD